MEVAPLTVAALMSEKLRRGCVLWLAKDDERLEPSDVLRSLKCEKMLVWDCAGFTGLAGSSGDRNPSCSRKRSCALPFLFLFASPGVDCFLRFQKKPADFCGCSMLASSMLCLRGLVLGVLRS